MPYHLEINKVSNFWGGITRWVSVLYAIYFGQEEVAEPDERHGCFPMHIEPRTDPLRGSVPGRKRGLIPEGCLSSMQ